MIHHCIFYTEFDWLKYKKVSELVTTGEGVCTILTGENGIRIFEVNKE